MISIDDFIKVEIKISKILSAEKVEGSEKLLKLMIDLGPSSAKASEGEGRDIRQILSGVAKAITEPKTLVGKMVPIVSNLEPRQMMGMESQGMMLCADDGTPVLLHPVHEVTPGSSVK
ncbi:MAG: methionine--tRNA ligase subunit beta [Patescibacteria group bacterium]